MAKDFTQTLSRDRYSTGVAADTLLVRSLRSSSGGGGSIARSLHVAVSERALLARLAQQHRGQIVCEETVRERLAETLGLLARPRNRL